MRRFWLNPADNEPEISGTSDISLLVFLIAEPNPCYDRETQAGEILSMVVCTLHLVKVLFAAVEDCHDH